MTFPRLDVPSLLVGFFVGVFLTVVLSGPTRGSRQGVPPTSAASREELETAENERCQTAARQEEATRQELERQRQREAELQRERERYAEQVRKAQEQAREKNRNAVKACAGIVRDRTDARLHKGASQFDAYVGDDSVKYFGTADERFQFDKC